MVSSASTGGPISWIWAIPHYSDAGANRDDAAGAFSRYVARMAGGKADYAVPSISKEFDMLLGECAEGHMVNIELKSDVNYDLENP